MTTVHKNTRLMECVRVGVHRDLGEGSVHDTSWARVR